MNIQNPYFRPIHYMHENISEGEAVTVYLRASEMSPTESNKTLIIFQAVQMLRVRKLIRRYGTVI